MYYFERKLKNNQEVLLRELVGSAGIFVPVNLIMVQRQSTKSINAVPRHFEMWPTYT